MLIPPEQWIFDNPGELIASLFSPYLGLNEYPMVSEPSDFFLHLLKNTLPRILSSFPGQVFCFSEIPKTQWPKASSFPSRIHKTSQTMRLLDQIYAGTIHEIFACNRNECWCCQNQSTLLQDRHLSVKSLNPRLYIPKRQGPCSVIIPTVLAPRFIDWIKLPAISLNGRQAPSGECFIPRFRVSLELGRGQPVYH